MALVAAASEAIWLTSVFKFGTCENSTRLVTMLADNQDVIKKAQKDSSGTRTKHIGIKYHFVRESHAKNLFSLQFCPTTDMAADILTKPEERVLLNKHMACLLYTSPSPRDRG